MNSRSLLPLNKHPNNLEISREGNLLVSIIVVTLGRDIDDLKECLDSLLTQTYAEIEILVVVDGHSPKIKTLLNQYLNKYGIRVFFNDDVVGISRARNIGIRESMGAIVAFIDDDAVAFNDWVENLVKCYDHKIAAVGGRVLPKNPPFHKIILALNQDFGDNEKSVDCLVGCNMSFRKSVFSETGLFNPLIDYGNDETDLALRLVNKGYEIKYCPKAVVKHDEARNWKKLIWKHFKFGEKTLYLPSPKRQSKGATSYKYKSRYLIQCFQENRSFSVIVGLLILYIVRRIGVVKALIEKKTSFAHEKIREK